MKSKLFVEVKGAKGNDNSPTKKRKYFDLNTFRWLTNYSEEKTIGISSSFNSAIYKPRK